MRFRPSFLRTTPARKPRTECCCHSVAVIKAAIVVPAGERSIARMRACLVSAPVLASDDERSDRERGLVLRLLGVLEGVGLLDFDLDLVMGSSEVLRRHPPHHLSPARAKPRRGARPRSAQSPLQVLYSNAPVEPVSQSNLSKIIALCAISYLLRTYESLSTRSSIGFL